MRRRRALLALAALGSMGAAAPVDYAADAAALDALIVANYAYLDHLPGGVLPQSAALTAERASVHDRASLLAWAQDRLATLADHHAITGASTRDAWAVVPTYADLWVEQDRGGYRIDAVRAGSPAAGAGIAAGDRLTAVDGVPVVEAVRRFWADFGLEPTGDRAAFAGRVLAAGRRDRSRVLTIAHAGEPRTLTLPTLYASPDDEPAVAMAHQQGMATVRLGNSLGDQTTIAAFDAAMARLRPGEPVLIDLTDTPSGGNTSVARGIMSWFVTRPTAYQVHSLPAEERERASRGNGSSRCYRAPAVIIRDT